MRVLLGSFILALLNLSAGASPSFPNKFKKWPRDHQGRLQVFMRDCDGLLGYGTHRFRKVQGYPGLFFLDGDPDHYSHEWRSARRFSKYLWQEFRETLILVPSVREFPVPGFDGFIVGSNGKVKANFSLKNVFGGKAKISKAVRVARRFQVREPWEKHGIPGNIRDQWVREGTWLFGATPDLENARPFRVFVEYEPESSVFRLADGVLKVTRDLIRTHKPYLKDVILLNGNRVHHVDSKGWRVMEPDYLEPRPRSLGSRKKRKRKNKETNP